MFKLIPRVRVNYTIADLIRGLIAGRGKGRKYDCLRREISKYFGIDDVLLTSSGRGSIYMLLKYLPQSKVIIPAYTCKVVVEAAMLAGKEVIYAPTSRKTFNISALPKLDEDCIVIATHQYGLPCHIHDIATLCKEVGAVLIEDCAGSLGTRINGKLTGLFGDFAIFSFDSSKLINVPSKGGFIISKNSDTLKKISECNPKKSCSLGYKIKHLSRGGIYVLLKSAMLYRCFHYLTMERKGKMQLEDHVGINTTLNEYYTHDFYEWQAAIVLRQFRRIDDIIKKRQKIYAYLNEHLNNTKITKPEFYQDATCIRYAVLVENKKRFYYECLKQGVDMGFSFNSVVCPTEWTEEHVISDNVLNIPSYYNLSEKECKMIVDVVNSIKSW